MQRILYEYIDYKKNYVQSSYSTYTRHLVSLSKFFEYLATFGVYEPQQIELYHITQFARYLLKQKAYKTSRYYHQGATMHLRTVRSYISVIRCFLEYCQTIRIPVISPAGIKSPIIHYPKPQTLDLEQVKLLLKQPQYEQREDMRLRNQILLMLGLYCGLRINEALSLKIEDVLTGTVLITGKFGNYRTITIYPPIIELIKQYIVVRNGSVYYEINRLGKQVTRVMKCKESKYLLVCHDARKNGEPMTPWTVSTVLRKYGPVIGVPRLNYHRLRGTFCTHSLDNGMSPIIVGEMAGHVDVKATQHYYSGSKNSFSITQAILYQ